MLREPCPEFVLFVKLFGHTNEPILATLVIEVASLIFFLVLVFFLLFVLVLGLLFLKCAAELKVQGSQNCVNIQTQDQTECES